MTVGPFLNVVSSLLVHPGGLGVSGSLLLRNHVFNSRNKDLNKQGKKQTKIG